MGAQWWPPSPTVRNTWRHTLLAGARSFAVLEAPGIGAPKHAPVARQNGNAHFCARELPSVHHLSLTCRLVEENVVHVQEHKYIFIYVCACRYMCFTCALLLYGNVFVYICAHMRVCAYSYMHVREHVRMFECVYIYI